MKKRGPRHYGVTKELMYMVVCYDIADPKRLKRIAKVMKGFGNRIQKSVFECDIDKATFARMLSRIEDTMDETLDSVRYYTICERCRGRKRTLGLETLVPDEQDVVIV